jgi:hypothetical protein
LDERTEDMNERSAHAVARVAAAVMFIGACSADEPRVLARGVVDFEGVGHLADHRMDISAEDEDGKVSGTIKFTCSPDSAPGSCYELIAVDLECADLDSDGVVIVAGEVTESSGDEGPSVGDPWTVVIHEAEPDRVALWFGGDGGSCEQLLESVPDELREPRRPPDPDHDPFLVEVVEDGDAIETG